MLDEAIIPDEGVEAYADLIINAISSGGNGSLIHLYANNYKPSRISLVVDFVEVAAAGLMAQPLPAPMDQGLSPEGKAVWLYPQTVFTATGAGLPQLVYGYWVDIVDPITLARRVIQAQRFVSPQALIAAGNTIKFQLSFGTRQC